eukprot:CAMPEP_0198247322 /NCGR_PEP_ID=MMETSP1446-20131203/46420_1 /TAXON_ID=1461542 ORGANISM="Unidentified sp, Strain CCMP2111" /NCGR_SAMPLE_ID=MMETSP1446 /ASSEMBLY_ACC=CAM_ASM_001112 /LENGTH=484 /DNA_ID=CAMNT_0043931647 /DNA_START=86 /DNA_END=1540 /DNA_ORIENTATION=+
MPRQKPAPLTLPSAQRTSFSLSDSGTFREGDLTISSRGLVISSQEGQYQSSQGGGSAADDFAFPQTRVPNGSSYAGGPAAQAVPLPGQSSDDRVSMGSLTSSSVLPVPQHPQDIAAHGNGLLIDDLVQIGVLGCGSSGVVRKVQHKHTGEVLALKVIQMNVLEDQVRKQINQELRALYEASSSPHVIRYRQAFYDSGAITIVMEYMDGGSLLEVMKEKVCIPEAHLSNIAAQVLCGLEYGGSLLEVMKEKVCIPEAHLSNIAAQVLCGLEYLHKQKRILHRDIKPSNLLVNRLGEVKITDFGVSGQLQNSVSKCVSWVGTITYMSPERISGGKYGYDSDIWSFGLTLVELALGRFPYPEEAPLSAGEATNPSQGQCQGQCQSQGEQSGQARRLSFWDLLHYIVEKPAPRLPANGSDGAGHPFSPQFRDFIDRCLQKDPEKRAPVADLLKHPFIAMYENQSKSNLAQWMQASDADGVAGDQMDTG